MGTTAWACRQHPSHGSNACWCVVAHPGVMRCGRSQRAPRESEEAERFCLSEDGSVLSTSLSPAECKGFSALICPVRMTGLSGTSPWLARTDICGPVHLGTAPFLASVPPGLSLPCAIILKHDRKWFGWLYHAVKPWHSHQVKNWIELVQKCKENICSLQKTF